MVTPMSCSKGSKTDPPSLLAGFWRRIVNEQRLRFPCTSQLSCPNLLRRNAVEKTVNTYPSALGSCKSSLPIETVALEPFLGIWNSPSDSFLLRLEHMKTKRNITIFLFKKRKTVGRGLSVEASAHALVESGLAGSEVPAERHATRHAIDRFGKWI